jgi:hypothetical protein
MATFRPEDTDKVRVEVNRIDALRLDLEGKLGISLIELKSFVGMTPEENLLLKGPLEIASVDAAADRPLQTVLQARCSFGARRVLCSNQNVAIGPISTRCGSVIAAHRRRNIRM